MMWSATSPAVQPSHGDSAPQAALESAAPIARVSPAAAVRSRSRTSGIAFVLGLLDTRYREGVARHVTPSLGDVIVSGTMQLRLPSVTGGGSRVSRRGHDR